jgi:hypothetical protein
LADIFNEVSRESTCKFVGVVANLSTLALVEGKGNPDRACFG